MADYEEKHCPKCGQDLRIDKNFFKRRDGSYVDLCKKCLTMHVDNFDPETFLWILEDMDFPYIEHQWNKHRERKLAKWGKLTGLSVLGSYCSSLRISIWKNYGFADSDYINAKYEKKQKEANTLNSDERPAEYEDELLRKLDAGEISSAQYKTLTSKVEAQKREMEGSSAVVIDNSDAITVLNPEESIALEALGGEQNPFSSNFIPESELVDLGAELTKDDKIYLATKWGRFYRPAEWVMLEQDYEKYKKSFDIQDADTENSLLELCKVNLKVHQAIDSNDVDTAQKYAKMQEMLRKSSKFTASQAKEEEKDVVNSVGELVAYCERYGGAIPKWNLDSPLDYVDVEMKDTQSYLRTLVYEDPTIAAQIDAYIKKRTIAQQQSENDKKSIIEGIDGIKITDEDYLDYSNSIAEQREQDAEVLNES